MHCVEWKIPLSKIYSISDTDNEYWSDVDNFPVLPSLVRICIDIKVDKKSKVLS